LDGRTTTRHAGLVEDGRFFRRMIGWDLYTRGGPYLSCISKTWGFLGVNRTHVLWGAAAGGEMGTILRSPDGYSTATALGTGNLGDALTTVPRPSGNFCWRTQTIGLIVTIGRLMDAVPGRVDATARCWRTEAAVDDAGAVASSTLFLSATVVAPAPADGKQFGATIIVLPSGNLAVAGLL